MRQIYQKAHGKGASSTHGIYKCDERQEKEKHTNTTQYKAMP